MFDIQKLCVTASLWRKWHGLNQMPSTTFGPQGE